MDQDITVKIDGVDETDKIVYPTLDVSSRSYSDSDRASFRISDTDSITLSPLTECEVIDNGKTIFGGLLTNYRETTEGIKRIYDLEFGDWSEELKNTVITLEKYENVPLTYIVLNLFKEHASDFTVIIDDDREVGEMIITKETLMDAVEKIQDDYKMDWFITPDKTIYLFKDLKSL